MRVLARGRVPAPLVPPLQAPLLLLWGAAHRPRAQRFRAHRLFDPSAVEQIPRMVSPPLEEGGLVGGTPQEVAIQGSALQAAQDINHAGQAQARTYVPVRD